MELTVANLSARYGQALALDKVSIRLGQGEVVGIFGRNGAGKTTLVRCVSRLHTSMSGNIQVDDQDVSNRPAHRVSRLGVSLVREGAPLPASLSVVDNLRLGQRAARMRGGVVPNLSDVWKLFPLLQGMEAKTAGYLSGGQRQMLALAVVFASQPSVLLLDEPSAGLAPAVAESVFEIIRRVAATGVSVLIIEQNLDWLAGVVQRGYILELGRINAAGTYDELVAGIRVKSASGIGSA
jgi:branched-chain amino acid transport system ATP-binding protein